MLYFVQYFWVFCWEAFQDMYFSTLQETKALPCTLSTLNSILCWMHSVQLTTPYILVYFPSFASMKPQSLNFLTTSLDSFSQPYSLAPSLVQIPKSGCPRVQDWALFYLYNLYQSHSFNSTVAPRCISPVLVSHFRTRFLYSVVYLTCPFGCLIDTST